MSIVHGGQSAIDAAVLKLYPEWADNSSFSAQTAVDDSPYENHASAPCMSSDSVSVLSIQDDLDAYLIEMDNDSVSSGGFRSVDDGCSSMQSRAANSRNHVGSKSASFFSTADVIETATTQPEHPASKLDMLNASITRVRLLKRAAPVAAYFEAGGIPCSDLDAGKIVQVL